MTAETYIALSRYYENSQKNEISQFFSVKAIGILSMQIKRKNRIKAIILITYKLFKDMINPY